MDAIGKNKLGRLAGIVGHRDRLQRKTTDREWRVRIEQFKRHACTQVVFATAQGTGGQPDGKVETVRKFECAAGVVIMFVCQDDGIQLLWYELQPCQPIHRVTNAESAIDQNSGRVQCVGRNWRYRRINGRKSSGGSFDNQSVAVTAAAKYCEAHFT